MNHKSLRLPAVVAPLLCAWLAAGCYTLGKDVIQPIVTGVLTDLCNSVARPLDPAQVAACWEGPARAQRPAAWMRSRAHNPGGPIPDNPIGAPIDVGSERVVCRTPLPQPSVVVRSSGEQAATRPTAVSHPQKDKENPLAEPQNAQPVAPASLAQPSDALQPVVRTDNLPLPQVLPKEPSGRASNLSGLHPLVRLVSPSTSPQLAPIWASYRGFEYDNAIQLATTTARQPNQDPFLRASAYILAGAAASMNGNAEEARVHFLKAVEVYPKAAPDPHVFPTEITAMYKQAVAYYEKEAVP